MFSGRGEVNGEIGVRRREGDTLCRVGAIYDGVWQMLGKTEFGNAHTASVGRLVLALATVC